MLRPLGWLGVFDGDYATATVALGEHDPLQACADAMMAARSMTAGWTAAAGARARLPAGVVAFRSHGFVDAVEPTYMLTIVDRGAELLRRRAGSGRAPAALKAEGGVGPRRHLLRPDRLRPPHRPQAGLSLRAPRLASGSWAAAITSRSLRRSRAVRRGMPSRSP